MSSERMAVEQQPAYPKPRRQCSDRSRLGWLSSLRRSEWLLAMFFLYTGIGFYTDKWVYERRQRRKAAGK